MGFLGASLMLLAVFSVLGLLAGTIGGIATQPQTNDQASTEAHLEKEVKETGSKNSERERQLVQSAVQADEENERRENELEERNRLHALHEVSYETIPYDDSYFSPMGANEPPWDVKQS